MSDQSRFIVRETKGELEKLDRALKTLGYFNRSDWYREKKRELLEKAAEREKK
jgi:metal-responsive CopG/Arc/MetJ family transcriptional regulator